MRGLRIACLAVVVCAAVVASAADYTWITAGPGNWSDSANWDPNTGYPGTKDDVGLVKDNTAAVVTYDASASGVLGGLYFWKGQIIIDNNVLLDYTGSTGNPNVPAGWAYLVG